MTTINEQQLLQQATKELAVQLQKIEALQSQISTDSAEIAQLDEQNSNLEQKYQHHIQQSHEYKYDTDGDDYTGQERAAARRDKAKMNANDAKINTIENGTATTTGLNSMISTLDSLDPGLTQIGKVLVQSLEGHQNSIAYASVNFNDFMNILHGILAQMSAIESLDNAANVQDADIKYGDYSAASSSNLDPLEMAVISANSNLQTAISNAMTDTQLVNAQSAMTQDTYDLTHQSVGDEIGSMFGMGNQQQLEDQIKAIQAFANLVSSIQKQMSHVNVVNLQMNQIIQTLNITIGKVESILADTHMSVAEKKAKILALLMVVLSLFSEAREVFAAVKSQVQTALSNANTATAKDDMIAVQNSQQDKAALKKTESEMKTYMSFLSYAFDLVMLLQSPIAFALIQTLSTAGVFKDISNAIANDLQKDGKSPQESKEIADGITAGIQVVMMVGIDKIGEKVTAKIAEGFVKELAKNATADTAELSGKTIELTVKKYFSQSLLRKLPGLVEGLGKKLAASAGKFADLLDRLAEKLATAVKEPVEVESQEIVDEAIANKPQVVEDVSSTSTRLSNLVQKIAGKARSLEKLLTIRSGLSEVVEKAQKEALSASLVGATSVDKIAEESASKALGDTVKKVDADGNRLSKIKEGASRLMDNKAFLYSVNALLSVMQNNVITDAVMAAQNGSNSAETQKVENVLNMIQEILEMLMMILAGAGSKDCDNTAASLNLAIQKVTNVIGVISGLSQSGLTIGQGVVGKELANVSARLTKQSGALLILEALIKQISGSGAKTANSTMQEAFAFYKSEINMSVRLSEGEKAQAQALLSFV